MCQSLSILMMSLVASNEHGSCLCVGRDRKNECAMLETSEAAVTGPPSRMWEPLHRAELKGDKLNGTNGFLQKSAVFCGFLRKSAVSCGFLRKSAPPKCCNSQEKRKSAKICENQRKTANFAHLSLLVCPF